MMFKTIILMAIFAITAHAQSITNSKNGEKLVFDFTNLGVEISHVDKNGHRENVNTLQTASQTVYTNNDLYHYDSVDFLMGPPNGKMPLLFSVSSLGILPVCDKIVTGLDQVRTRELNLLGKIGTVLAEIVTMPVCLVSAAPGLATVAVAALGESGLHGGKYLFNKEAIALRKLQQVYEGENVWASNRVFKKILKDLRKI